MLINTYFYFLIVTFGMSNTMKPNTYYADLKADNTKLRKECALRKEVIAQKNKQLTKAFEQLSDANKIIKRQSAQIAELMKFKNITLT